MSYSNIIILNSISYKLYYIDVVLTDRVKFYSASGLQNQCLRLQAGRQAGRPAGRVVAAAAAHRRNSN